MNNSEVRKYPDYKWVKNKLRNNFVSRVNYPVLGIYVVGSEARGIAKPGSDLDIAILIPSVKGKSALQISDNYHAKFLSDQFKPHWGDRVVDFQFFYPDDPELESYSKIPIQEYSAKPISTKFGNKVRTIKTRHKRSSVIGSLRGLRS